MPNHPADPDVARALAQLCLDHRGSYEGKPDDFADEILARLPDSHEVKQRNDRLGAILRAHSARPLLRSEYGLYLAHRPSGGRKHAPYRLMLRND